MVRPPKRGCPLLQDVSTNPANGAITNPRVIALPIAPLLALVPNTSIGPELGILGVDGLLDFRDWPSLLVHGIRIQRNVEADASPSRVLVSITVQVVLVTDIFIAPAVAGHPLNELGHLPRNPVGLGDLAIEEAGR